MVTFVSRKNSSLFIISLVLIFVLLPAAVFAQTEAEHQEMIRQNCSSAQVSLQVLQRRDSVSRVNRGRAYTDLQKQIAAFNSRLTYNKIDAPQFTQLATDLQTNIDAFRTAYNDGYYNAMSNAIKLDCKQHPTEFYNYINEARHYRNEVSIHITSIDELIDKYKAALQAYQATL